jgi:hypothetical protein
MKFKGCALKILASARTPVAAAAVRAEREMPISARSAGDIPFREAKSTMIPAPIRDAATDSETSPYTPIRIKPAIANAWTTAAPPPRPNN